jgi:hypothetical protein
VGTFTFNFNPATKKLVIHRAIRGDGESVMLHVYNHKPDQVLLNDTRCFPWLQDYAYSMAKHMLGEAREKFATIAGPQGGTSLNGAAMKTEANTEMLALMESLTKYEDASTPLTWVVG